MLNGWDALALVLCGFPAGIGGILITAALGEAGTNSGRHAGRGALLAASGAALLAFTFAAAFFLLSSPHQAGLGPPLFDLL